MPFFLNKLYKYQHFVACLLSRALCQRLVNTADSTFRLADTNLQEMSNFQEESVTVQYSSLFI